MTRSSGFELVALCQSPGPMGSCLTMDASAIAMYGAHFVCFSEEFASFCLPLRLRSCDIACVQYILSVLINFSWIGYIYLVLMLL